MQSESRNQPVADWAKRNLSQPVQIRLRYGSRARTLIQVLLFLVPALLVATLGLLKIAGSARGVSWWGIFLFGFVLSIPAIVIVLLGRRTRQDFAASLDAAGVATALGRRLAWEDLRYVDHVSKVEREGGVTRKLEDNQLELVFSGGKVIIPPLIEERERIWALVHSMPAQVRHDGEVRGAQPSPLSGAAPAFEDIVKTMAAMKAQHDRNK